MIKNETVSIGIEAVAYILKQKKNQQVFIINFHVLQKSG
jgi:hypothetical protein